MQVRTFRGMFTILLGIILLIFGIIIGRSLPALPAVMGLPSGKDLIAHIPNYAIAVVLALGVVGFLIGVYIGPRVADQIIQAGTTLERMSAADKIAVLLGSSLGVLVTLPFYLMISRPPVPIPVQVALTILLLVIFVYLGVVATVSMKAELTAMLQRPAGPTPTVDDSRPTANCKILDTNVIIDGRIADVCRAGFVEGTLYVPGFVLEELQHIADSGDSLKRARGRRGLDILNNMQKELPLIVRSWDKELDKSAMDDEVDTRLVKLAKALEGAIVTNDFNLNKVAALQGVQVLNVNELANALKPVVLPGEVMTVGIVKEGKEQNQGVAYLDDGTMIVVEDGRRYIGETLGVVVTSVLQTVAGKMIFARVRSDDDGDGYDYHGNRESRSEGTGNGYGGSSSGYPRRGQGKKIR